MCVRVGRVVSLGFHRQSFNQWDVIVLLIKSTAYFMHGASGSHWTSGKGICSVSLFFVTEVLLVEALLSGAVDLPESCGFIGSLFITSSYCLNKDPGIPHFFFSGCLQCSLWFFFPPVFVFFFFLNLSMYFIFFNRSITEAVTTLSKQICLFQRLVCLYVIDLTLYKRLSLRGKCKAVI